MRGVVAVVLLMLACEGGCGEDGADERGVTEVRPPEGLSWEASLGGGRPALRSLRELLPPAGRALVPEAPGGVLERIVPDLPVGEVVPDDADVHAIRLELGPLAPVVAAARVPVSDDALAPDLPLVPGAPHGGRWVRDAPGAGAPAAMVLGDVLIVSQHAAALERAAPWLAWELVARDAPRGIVVRFPEGAASGALRRNADAALAEWSTDALESIRTERARHDEPPPFGDPEELVGAARDLLGEWIAYLPDVGAVRIHARAEPVGLVVDLDADVGEGSPLARALDRARTVPSASLLALPEDTALALVRAADAGDAPSFARRTIERVAGERLDEAARSRIAEVDRALGTGGAPIVAAGGSAGGAWLMIAASQALEPDPFRDALAAAFVRDVGGALLGCDGPIAPQPFEAGDHARSAVLCAGDPPLRLLAGSAEVAGAIAIARGDRNVALDTALRLGAEREGGLGDDPDAARVLSTVEEDAIAAGFLAPSRVLAAGSLFAPLRRDAVDPGRTAPIAASVSRTESGLRLRVAGTAAAVGDLIAVVAPFLGVD